MTEDVVTDDHLLFYLRDMDQKYRKQESFKPKFRSEEGEALLNQLLELQQRVSANPFINNTLALLYLTHGNPEEAIKVLLEAVRFAPENKFYQTNLAVAYYQAGKVDQAIQCLRESKIISFDEWDWEKDLAEFDINEDLIRKEYMELYPEKMEAEIRSLHQQGNQLVEQGQYEPAIDYYLTILDAQPENFEILNNIGVCYLHLQNFKVAQRYFEKAMVIDPTAYNVLLNFALLFMITKKYEQAVGILKKAHAAYPDDALFLFYLAKAYAHLKHNEKAIKYLMSCLYIAPEYYLEVDQERVFHPLLKHLEV